MSLKLMYSDKDIAAARKRCKQVIGVYTDLPELFKECEISVLIPIYDESVQRLKKQIRWFSKQKFRKDAFELVYVVNNAPPNGTSENKRAIRTNAKAMAFLRRGHRMHIRVIDRSSTGREILECNVGKARDFGLHVVAMRYLNQKREGIIIHTDGDSTPRRTDYLESMWSELKNPRVFGAAGGVDLVMDLDTANAKDRAFFRKHIQALRNYSKWHFLVKSTQVKSLKLSASPKRFSGAHMISKAVAGVLCGGFSHVSRAEDVFFGEALEAFAKKHRARVLPRRKAWIMDTAIRESTRTDASFGPVLENIKKHGGKPLVRAVETPHYHEFLKVFLAELEKADDDVNEMKRLFGPGYGRLRPSYARAFSVLAKSIKKKSPDSRLKMFFQWRQNLTDKGPALYIRKRYETKYPPVPLTKSRLAKLQKEVFKDPKKKAYVLNALDAFADYKLPPKNATR